MSTYNLMVNIDYTTFDNGDQSNKFRLFASQGILPYHTISIIAAVGTILTSPE